MFVPAWPSAKASRLYSVYNGAQRWSLCDSGMQKLRASKCVYSGKWPLRLINISFCESLFRSWEHTCGPKATVYDVLEVMSRVNL